MSSVFRMEGIFGMYACNTCNQSHTFSERMPAQKVRRFYCDHFNLVLKFIISNGLKVQVTTSCNKCFKEIHEVSKMDKVMRLIGEGCIFLDTAYHDMQEFYVLGRLND